MQTALAAFIRDTEGGRKADAILRRCVHCGFCNATCPTYQLLGDELDGPRGRIYLMKQILEGHTPGRRTQLHLDRCLTCRACETACPSGVRYAELLDIGRLLIERWVKRPWAQRLLRWGLRRTVPYPRRFAVLLAIARRGRILLPSRLRREIPAASRPATDWPGARHARRMLVLEGCVQPLLAPAINAAAARVLDRLGISLLVAPGAGCCGALSHHLAAVEEGRAFARRNIDAWWPYVESGIEAIVATASGCGMHLKDYGRLLCHDPVYGAKAARVAALTRDLSEVLDREDLSVLGPARAASKIAFHSPCTLQHGQQLTGVVERLLRSRGFVLTPVEEAHLCCGSAGSYSILQRRLARRLRERKLAALVSGGPEAIATANIGCLVYLRCAARVPVVHWVELLAKEFA